MDGTCLMGQAWSLTCPRGAEGMLLKRQPGRGDDRLAVEAPQVPWMHVGWSEESGDGTWRQIVDLHKIRVEQKGRHASECYDQRMLQC